MTIWRCAICGCGLDEAQAKRRRRGEPSIRSVIVQTCSRACEEKRQAARAEAQRGRRAQQKPRARLARRVGRARRKRRRVITPEGYWRRRYRRLRVPRELAWRCRECDCTFEAAQAKRRRRGEQEIRSLKTRTCCTRCRSSYRAKIIRRWERLHPEATREYGRRAHLRKRWKLYSEQHQGAEPYPDRRRRRSGNQQSR